MGMKQTIDVINRMEADGIIGRYAICGAVAAYNYIEPALTDDLDILVAFEPGQAQPQSGLVTLGPVLSYLKGKGYSEFQREAVLIEGWAIQLIPVASDLDAEALAKAEPVDLEVNPAEGSVKTRVLRPEYIVRPHYAWTERKTVCASFNSWTRRRLRSTSFAMCFADTASPMHGARFVAQLASRTHAR
jgi:hypothetical protein